MSFDGTSRHSNYERPKDLGEGAYVPHSIADIARGALEEVAQLKGLVKKQAEQIEDLQHANEHDDLTGLYRGKVWGAILEKNILEKRATGVVFIDLTSFKRINDNLGHQRGDELLVQFSKFLENSFRRESDSLGIVQSNNISDSNSAGKDDTVAGRLGGDEFGLLFNLDGNGVHRGNGKSTFEHMDDEFNYVGTILNAFVESQPEDIKALGFEIAVGGSVYDPNHLPRMDENHPTIMSVVIAQAEEDMYEDKATQASRRQ